MRSESAPSTAEGGYFFWQLLQDAGQTCLRAHGELAFADAPRLAAELGLSEGALRTTLHRFLRDYRALLEEEVLQTVASRDEMEEEIAHLQDAFRKG